MGTWGKTGFRLDNFSEADLELCLTPNLHLLEEGLELIGRQVDIGFGVLDLLCRDAEGCLVVVEIKRDVIDVNAVGQIVRYISHFEDEIEDQLWRGAGSISDRVDEMNDLVGALYSLPSYKVRGYLVAPKINDDAARLINYISSKSDSESIRYRSITLLMVPSSNSHGFFADRPREREEQQLESRRKKVKELIPDPAPKIKSAYDLIRSASDESAS